MSQSYSGALKLHQYIMAEHWKRDALVGPDPGVRFNYRLGRFFKSYLPRVAWGDDYYYLQAQGYWVLANWALYKRTEEAAYREIALRCSDTMLDQQRDNGAWDFPNPEWKGRIPAAEGTWGSIGLVESYRHSAEPRFLVGALRWHKFLLDEIGFQSVGEELAVNYFSNRPSQRVPNNSAFVLRFLAELSDVTGDSTYLEPSRGLLTFLRNAQRSNGEFPYALPGPLAGGTRLHFQCYQYNAFQCLDLMRFYELSGERSVVPLITRVLQFLCEGLAHDGHAYYDCEDHTREVTYHTAALAACVRQGAGPGN